MYLVDDSFIIIKAAEIKSVIEKLNDKQSRSYDTIIIIKLKPLGLLFIV